jgi:hypothetical protein
MNVLIEFINEKIFIKMRYGSMNGVHLGYMGTKGEKLEKYLNLIYITYMYFLSRHIHIFSKSLQVGA